MSSLTSDDKKYRKNIFRKINRIRKKELYFQIYQTILDHKEIHNVNSNGVFFDIYKISLTSIKEIDKILYENDINTESNNTENNNYQNYSESITEQKINNDIFINKSQLPISHLDKL